LKCKVLLDGEPFLDLPGMLQYINGRNSQSSDKISGNKSSILKDKDSPGVSHLDMPGSPAKNALDRVGNIGGKVGLELKQVIVHMTQKNPNKRNSIADYRKQLEGGEKGNGSNDESASVDCPFPSYFTSVLYPLYLQLHWEGVGPDQRIAILCQVSSI
jgi:hypothetical protein